MRRTLLVAAVMLAGTALAAKPVRNVNAGHHPNIAAAQKLVAEAFDKITAAQQANEWDMKGHAEKAKHLLEQANVELKAAAETANHPAK